MTAKRICAGLGALALIGGLAACGSSGGGGGSSAAPLSLTAWYNTIGSPEVQTVNQDLDTIANDENYGQDPMSDAEQLVSDAQAGLVNLPPVDAAEFGAEHHPGWRGGGHGTVGGQNGHGDSQVGATPLGQAHGDPLRGPFLAAVDDRPAPSGCARDRPRDSSGCLRPPLFTGRVRARCCWPARCIRSPRRSRTADCWLAAPWTPATKARAFGRTSST